MADTINSILHKKRNIKIKNPNILKRERFPLSSQYDPLWVLERQMGPNALWLVEWLTEKMDLKPGMRVLDMGCGLAMTSVFLAREFGVQVWANDLWVTANENWESIREAGLEDQIYPVHAEAHELPYADEFFDAIVSLDSYQYYGTDDLYMNYFHRFVKKSGQIGIVVPGGEREIPYPIPEHLIRQRKDGSVFWEDGCWSFHSPEWWRKHWEKNSFLKVENAELMPQGCDVWLDWERVKVEANRFPSDIETLEEDKGKYIGLTRIIARRV